MILCIMLTIMNTTCLLKVIAQTLNRRGNYCKGIVYVDYSVISLCKLWVTMVKPKKRNSTDTKWSDEWELKSQLWVHHQIIVIIFYSTTILVVSQISPEGRIISVYTHKHTQNILFKNVIFFFHRSQLKTILLQISIHNGFNLSLSEMFSYIFSCYNTISLIFF